MKFPAEMREQIKQAVFSLHGGQKQFECWLTQIADTLAGDPDLLKPIPVVAGLPQNAADLMGSPTTVVDAVLDFTEELQLFDYRIDHNKQAISVTDLFSMHVIETCPYSELNLKSISNKYGVEDGILSEC